MITTLITAFVALLAAAPGTDQFTQSFDVGQPSEGVAVVHAGCARCDWGEAGREAAALRIAIDGKYSQHLLLSRGELTAEYRISLGPLAPGRHQLMLERDPALSARQAGAATIEGVDVALIAQSAADDFIAQSMAPILHARANTIGRFTDLPLAMWYEILPTPRGRQFRYSVIFSNEDGGTATDRLMATWGRTTDIEFVYGAEIDRAGRVLAEEFQGPGHEVPPFRGQHEARHPLEWVSTDNNMVSDSGSTSVRYAPVPVRFDLRDTSREAVMDANPWMYAVMGQEMRREGKIADDAPPGHNTIPDPRRFVYVEACGQVGDAALALAIGVRRNGEQPGDSVDWIPSDRGVRQYRIVRDGCFRAATPLPAGTHPRDIRAIRVLAFERPPADDTHASAPPGPVRVTQINKVFMLDERFLPGPSILKWQGSASIRVGGSPLEIPIR